MYQRPDGIVDFNRDTCIGCKACIVACPYDAIYIDPQSHSAEKCNFCAHRIDMGLEPACVVVCPTQAIIVGDMNDPQSRVSQLIAREETQVRRPEKHTLPKLFYVNGSEAALNPLYASGQQGYMTSESRSGSNSLDAQSYVMGGPGEKKTTSGYPEKSAAAAILAYQSESKPMWDWPISGYLWAKSVSAGVFMVAAIGWLMNGLGGSLAWDAWVVVISAIFIAITGGFLVLDLSHPERFYTILIRPQWRSWVARGTFLILGFSVALALFLTVRLVGIDSAALALRWVGLALAVPTAVYTAFLLSQARGRDLWQNPALPAHFIVQAGIAGSAALILLGWGLSLTDTEVQWLRWALGLPLGFHLLLSLSDLVMPHRTENGNRAAKNMIFGKWASLYWGDIVQSLAALVLVAVSSTLAPGLVIAAFLSLIGLFMHEHAYIRAGQSVPQS